MADEAEAMQGNHEPAEAPDAPWLHSHYTLELDEFDVVERPAHYNQGNLEVIDVIEDKLTKDQFIGYCMGNVYKYTMRFQYKGGFEDLAKAKWYHDRAMQAMEGVGDRP
jgi:UTP-glucose-1-phosphate uridylyltransferase